MQNFNAKKYYPTSISDINTTIQHRHATGKSPHPLHAAAMPSIIASIPAMGDDVASTIAGKVITASVTYGT